MKRAQQFEPGFLGISYYSCSKEPKNSVGTYFGPYIKPLANSTCPQNIGV